MKLDTIGVPVWMMVLWGVLYWLSPYWATILLDAMVLSIVLQVIESLINWATRSNEHA